MTQVLHYYHDTWCPNCGQMTAHDGWDLEIATNLVTIYCDVCGKAKESFPRDQVPDDLAVEVDEVQADASHD